MSNSITRRQILTMASGFVAGAAAVRSIPLLVNVSADPANAQSQPATPAVRTRDEFVGPIDSWSNVKTLYNATGNGIADDTNALQQALNKLGSDNHSKVLYLPAGTYRITQTLTITSHINVSVLGEDPSNTTIKWDGPQDGKMLYLNGVRYSRFGRLTLDGSGKALIAVDQSWDGKTPNFDTGNEYVDQVFKDVGYGIQAGNLGHGAAESVVLRCQFLRNSKAGIITKNFNALDWFIWYSTFKDCTVGVTNDPGAGNFHVFESLFLNSTEADVQIKNAQYFSIRNNFSLNSKAFFVAKFVGQNGALTTIQGNTIIDSLDNAAIRMENLGPVLLIDNAIRSRQGVTDPVVKYSTFAPVDLVSVGNKFTASNTIEVNGRSIALDDQVVKRDVINANTPTMPGTLPNLKRKVFAVPVGASAVVIQQAIDAANKQGGQRPVVYLPSGNYPIERTLVIPSGSDVQLVGDGYGTSLSWVGTGAGPVLRLTGPTHATLSHFSVNGASKSNGIVVEKADQPGARVSMEQSFLELAEQYNLLVDGLDHTHIDLHDFYHSDSKGTSVKVVGGPSAANGTSLGGRTNIFGGASSNSNLSYAVTNNGRLMARDIWYESSNLPGFALLTGKGTFTFHGAKIATQSGKTTPAVEINNFAGKATFLAGIIDDRIVVKGDVIGTKVLALGMQGSGDYLVNNSPSAQVALLNSRKYADGSYSVPNQGNPAAIVEETTTRANFIRDMLAQTRNQQPKQLTSISDKKITDVRFYRVKVQSSLIGVHLKP